MTDDDVEWFEEAETCEHKWKQIEFTTNVQCEKCGTWGGS